MAVHSECVVRVGPGACIAAKAAAAKGNVFAACRGATGLSRGGSAYAGQLVAGVGAGRPAWAGGERDAGGINARPAMGPR